MKELLNESGRAKLVDDGSPLTFGDWMATIEHNMKDISTYSAMWWEDMCDSAKVVYAKWLVARPLELPVVCLDLPRTEQRGVVMVLKALPEQVKKELVANRQLSMVNIIYRLYFLYQPGGAARMCWTRTLSAAWRSWRWEEGRRE